MPRTIIGDSFGGLQRQAFDYDQLLNQIAQSNRAAQFGAEQATIQDAFRNAALALQQQEAQRAAQLNQERIAAQRDAATQDVLRRIFETSAGNRLAAREAERRFGLEEKRLGVMERGHDIDKEIAVGREGARAQEADLKAQADATTKEAYKAHFGPKIQELEQRLEELKQKKITYLRGLEGNKLSTVEDAIVTEMENQERELAGLKIHFENIIGKKGMVYGGNGKIIDTTIPPAPAAGTPAPAPSQTPAAPPNAATNQPPVTATTNAPITPTNLLSAAEAAINTPSTLAPLGQASVATIEPPLEQQTGTVSRTATDFMRHPEINEEAYAKQIWHYYEPNTLKAIMDAVRTYNRSMRTEGDKQILAKTLAQYGIR